MHFASQIAEFAYDDQPNKKIKVYNLGFPIGSKLHEEVTANDAVAEHYVLNNHLRFKILYHPAADEMDDIPGEMPSPYGPRIQSRFRPLVCHQATCTAPGRERHSGRVGPEQVLHLRPLVSLSLSLSLQFPALFLPGDDNDSTCG
jgi:hypothetical protein